MNRTLTGLIGVGATLCVAAVACHSNPLADGSGTPVAVVANYSAVGMANDSTLLVVTQVVDNRQTPLVATISGATAACSPSTPGDTGAVTVAMDPTYSPVPPGISTRFVVTSTHIGRKCLAFSSSGATSATVAVSVH